MSAQKPEDPLGWLLLARQLARQAGDLVLSLRHPAPAPGVDPMASAISIESKSSAIDLVTSADLASQRLIFSGISTSYPSHRLIGEEDAEHYGTLDDRPTWIVDAIDGTTNFVHGLSDFAVSIAFTKDQLVQVGVVYCPTSKEMFTAVRGRGAFLNDRPIRVSSKSSLVEALVISEWGYEREDEGVRKMLAVNHRLMVRKTRGVRQLGSGTLNICYVGMGRVDAVYCGVASESWHIWDYAAASLIAQEAGAVFTTIDGGEFRITARSMVCAAPGVLKELLAVINNRESSEQKQGSVEV